MKTIQSLGTLLAIIFLSDASAQIKNLKLLLNEPGKENAYPRLSKDGKQFLYQSNRNGKWQLYTFDIASQKSKQITTDSSNNNFPDWNRNNDWIAFVSDRSGNEEIYLQKTDGSGLRKITDHASRDIHPYFSPDGKYILFNSDRFGSLDIFRYTISDGKLERLTDTQEDETCAHYSPDMKEIVFLRNSFEMDDVFVMDMSNGLTSNVTKTPVITDGWPVYSPDSKWICYSSMENGSYSIYRIYSDGSGKEQLTNAPKGEEHARVSVSGDGKTILFNKKTGNTIMVYLANI